mgnify:CR=1 FL=1
MKKLMVAIGAAAAIAAFFVVNAVENGAALSTMLWLIPCFAVIAGAMSAYKCMQIATCIICCGDVC